MLNFQPNRVYFRPVISRNLFQLMLCLFAPEYLIHCLTLVYINYYNTLLEKINIISNILYFHLRIRGDVPVRASTPQ